MKLARTDYPLDLPCASRSPYSMALDAGVIRDQEGTPRTTQRRVYTNLPTTLSIMFNITPVGLFAWQAWVNKNAYRWFNLRIAHPFMADGMLTEVVPVRFVAGTLEMSFDNFGNVEVSTTIELSPVVYAESDLV